MSFKYALRILSIVFISTTSVLAATGAAEEHSIKVTICSNPLKKNLTYTFTALPFTSPLTDATLKEIILDLHRNPTNLNIPALKAFTAADFTYTLDVQTLTEPCTASSRSASPGDMLKPWPLWRVHVQWSEDVFPYMSRFP